MSKLLLSLILALPAWAGEYAVLANGFRIHAERHENDGSIVRLYTNDGVTEMPAASVVSFGSGRVYGSSSTSTGST